jgi:hypothetical protein
MATQFDEMKKGMLYKKDRFEDGSMRNR